MRMNRRDLIRLGAMTGAGVDLGATSACQTDMYKPGSPASSTVGTSGAAGMRVLPVTANGLTRPAFKLGTAVTGWSK